VAELFAAELHDLEARIACLTRSRDTIRDFLALTEHAALVHEGGAGAGAAARAGAGAADGGVPDLGVGGQIAVAGRVGAR
jgi:hypothetical protein